MIHDLKISNTLLEMGMPIKLKGFHYIVDAIKLLDKPEWKRPKWTALYHSVAVLNDDSDSCVEKAIRKAFKATREKGDYDLTEYYIGYINCDNSNSLMLLYNRLKQNE